MLVLITYDVSVTADGGQRRLRQIAKVCMDYGMRVQNSVFECEINPEHFVVLKNSLLEIYDPEHDSLRFYFLGKKWRKKVIHFGAKMVPDIFSDSLIV